MSIPSSNKYPEFVPDQLLTSEHLNRLFAYNDGEGRATRSRLIGIGLVCGLDVKAAAASITITKGCGITTAGYLARLEEDTTYTHFKTYDPLTEHRYNRFLNATQTAGAFVIQELVREATVEGATPLTATAMQGKAVLMFVELLAEGAKNCDPASCDDKGTTVTVSYKPMLVDTAVAQSLMGEQQGANIPVAAAAMPQLRMPRYDVPATPLINAVAVLDGFRKVLKPAFLNDVESQLKKAYELFAPLVSDLYPDDPFQDLAADFAEQHSDLDAATMLALQYHYDLFSDLMLAYEELRRAGEGLLTVCCPDEDLFPRHLVLGAVAGGEPRHAFQPSAALSGESKQVSDLRLLFRRLVLLVQRFSVPAPKQSGKRTSVPPIRITPSQWGKEPLSARAIPFYYKVENPAPALFQHWSTERAQTGTSSLILSYHSGQYSTTPTVVDPLRYDLESFDFLRIEGHIGQKMPTALANILKQKAENRLPFEVVALGADLRNVSRLIRSLLQRQRVAITSLTNAVTITGIRANLSTLNRAAAAMLQSAAGKNGLLGDCHVQDLEAIYDTLRAEFECILCCEMQYFYDVEPQRQRQDFTHVAGANAANNAASAAAGTLVPAIPLLKSCAPEFRYKAGSLGQSFEALWPTLAARPYNSPDQWLEQVEALLVASAGNAAGTNKDVLGLLMALLLLYYTEKLWEILPASLSVFDAEAFATRYEDLMQVARALKELIDDDVSGEGNGDNNTSDLFMTEDVIDHLDALIYACKDSAFEAVYREFLLRYMRALLRQKFGFFANQHPGLQHKAGVPMGGTFVLVYHEAEIELEDEEQEAQNVLAAAQQRIVAFRTFFQAKKAQAVGTSRDNAASKADATSTAKAETTGTATAGLKPEELEMKVVKQTTTYSKLLTEGDAKAMAFFEKYSAALRLEEEEDTTLQDLLDELPDGTVIADFCLPYLCCSDCPPMQFVVHGGSEEEPGPEKPTLNIEQKDYCQDDKGEYPIVVTPAGGKLSGEGTNEAKLTFQPSAVALASGAASKTVPITYTTDGGTDSKTVTVFAKPAASFKASVSPASPLAYTFEDTSTHAQSWEWDFGGSATSTDQSPQHTFQKRGETVITLTVHNGPCRNVAQQTIFVGGNGESSRPVCASLADIVADFESFDKAIGRSGTGFIEAFDEYKDAKTFFQLSLPELAKKSTSDQIESFAENKLVDALVKWMERLNGFVVEGVHRTLALALYNLLVRLLLYIACIQSEDVNKARAATEAALKILEKHIESWKNARQNLTSAEKKLLEQLSADLTNESTRAAARGGKPRYEKILDACISALKP